MRSFGEKNNKERKKERKIIINRAITIGPSHCVCSGPNKQSNYNRAFAHSVCARALIIKAASGDERALAPHACRFVAQFEGAQ